MAKYRVTSPSGETFEITAPDDATEQQVMRYARLSFKSAKPTSDPVVDGTGQFVRGVNRGVNALVELPGRIAGGVADLAGFPETAESLRWNNAVSRFMKSDDVQPTTELGRYANATGQAIGASALPTGALVANSSRLAAMTPGTVMGGVVQDVGRRVAAAPGAAVAADVTAATGGAVGSQSAKEAGYGPGTQSVAGFAGALVPTAVGGVAASIARPLRRAAVEQGQSGAYGNIANSVEGGADQLGRDVALGGAEGGAAGRVRQTALRVLGEEMVRANGNAVQAEAATIARIARETGVTPQAARANLASLRAVNVENPLMLGEVPSVARSDAALRGPAGGLRSPGNVNIDELKRVQDSATRGKFDYLASSGNAPSAVQTRNALAVRQDELADNFRAAVGRIQQSADSHGRSLNITDADNLIEGARRQAAQAYEAAYNGPIDNRIMMQTLPRVLSRFEGAARMRAGDVEIAMNNAVRQFYTQTPNGPVAMMTLRQLQDSRSRLREMITAHTDAGEASLARPLHHLYRQVTAIMSGMSPQWARANREWADMALDRVGRDLGDAFSKTPGPRFREHLRQFNQLNPQAQDIVRVHYAQKLLDNVERASDTHSIAKFFTTDHNRNAIRTLFGDRGVVQFTRAVRNIEAAEKTFQQNSRTHIRGQVKGQEETYTSLEAAKRSWSLSAIRDLLLEKAGQVLTERRNRPMADIITTPVSDTPRVAMHIERMRRQEARIQAFMQRRERPRPVVGVASSQDVEYPGGNRVKAFSEPRLVR